jgi:NADH-quinone oxidoreductase subunit G
VRVAIGEEFGLAPGAISTGQMVAAIRRLGFDRVFDTTFTADLTTVEETNEFINRLLSVERLPQFTSCCPAWVKTAEQYYPEKLDRLSTCRSPQAMFGSVLKQYYPKQAGLDPHDVFAVSIMPCTAKKFEAQRPEFSHDGAREVDAVLTTQELARMIKSAGIVFNELEEESFDMSFSYGTGAGVIYGASGGVATAVVREATAILTGERITNVDLAEVENLPGVRDAHLKIGDRPVSLAVVSGLGNARRLVASMDRGEVSYDIVEVMACPGGCSGGGGQPVPNETKQRQARAKGLFTADKRQGLRLAQDNLLIKELYRDWLGQPNGEVAHHALHTTYGHRRRMVPEVGEPAAEGPAVCVKVCVGTSCYLRGARNVLRRINDEIEEHGLAEAVELSAAFCFEQCDRGPNVQINGQEFHGVQEEDVPGLLFRALTAAGVGEAVSA